MLVRGQILEEDFKILFQYTDIKIIILVSKCCFYKMLKAFIKKLSKEYFD